MARARNLRPVEGARFLLEREASTQTDDAASAGPTRALYRASIFTPDAEFTTSATLGEDGTVSLASPSGAPGNLDERLENIAKLVARDAPKRREDGLVVWPARILRWRK